LIGLSVPWVFFSFVSHQRKTKETKGKPIESTPPQAPNPKETKGNQKKSKDTKGKMR
jgi:hypothetical protein